MSGFCDDHEFAIIVACSLTLRSETDISTQVRGLRALLCKS